MAIDGPFRNPERSLEIPRCPECGYRLNIELPTGESGSCPRCGAILSSHTKKDQEKQKQKSAKEIYEEGLKQMNEMIEEAGAAIRMEGKLILETGVDGNNVQLTKDINLAAKAITEQFKLFNKKMTRYYKETKPDKKEALKEELVTVSKVIQEMILKLETLTQGHSEFKETYVRVKGLEQDLAKFLSILNLA